MHTEAYTCGNVDHLSASPWHAHSTVAQKPTSQHYLFLLLIPFIACLSSTAFGTLPHHRMGGTSDKSIQRLSRFATHTSISYVSWSVLPMCMCSLPTRYTTRKYHLDWCNRPIVWGYLSKSFVIYLASMKKLFWMVRHAKGEFQYSLYPSAARISQIDVENRPKWKPSVLAYCLALRHRTSTLFSTIS